MIFVLVKDDNYCIHNLFQIIQQVSIYQFIFVLSINYSSRFSHDILSKFDNIQIKVESPL